MPNPAIEFDFPPPIKPKEIRLVLPEEQEQPNIRICDDSITDYAYRCPTESHNFTPRDAELNALELALIEREEALNQAEARLAERERSLWEFEALMLAREKLLLDQQAQFGKQKTNTPESSSTKEALEQLQQLRTEIEQLQENLEQSKAELQERERFVEASEDRLLEKTMQQQEEESRLEQIKEDLDARERRIRQLEGKPPPPEPPKEVL